MIDYKFKAEVMTSHPELITLQKEISKAKFISFYPTTTVFSKFTIDEAMDWEQELMTEFPDEYKEAEKINHANYERTHRLKERIKFMMSLGDCLFLTFTFNNGTLLTTKASSRRQFVRKFLSLYSNKYVANIDYGAKKGREHYHAVILTDNVDPHLWKYGALNIERIHKANSEGRLSNYISKLTNHAIKKTTKRSVIIYGRSKD